MINLLYFALIVNSLSLSTFHPVWTSSNYIRAGNQNVISTMTNETQYPIPNHNFTFSSALTGVPNLGYGIKDYEGFDYLGQQWFEVNRTYLDRFQFRVVVQIKGNTNILLLNVAYIAIDPTFPHHLNSFDNIPVNYSAGDIVNVTSMSVNIQTYTNIINYTQLAASNLHSKFSMPLSRNKILLFMTTLRMRATLQLNGVNPNAPININILTQPISETQFKIQLNASTMINISKVHFSIIVFDEQDVEDSGDYQLVYQKIKLPYTGGFIPLPFQFRDNFIMGMIQFSTNLSQSILYFTWDFQVLNSTEGIFMPQVMPQTMHQHLGTNSIQTVTYTLFYLKTWICPNSTFFDPNQNLCTQCPIVNCRDCQNITVCRQCEQENDYFRDSLTKQCSKCNLGGCIDCLSLTQCGVCNSTAGYTLLNDGSCFRCNIIPNYFLNISSGQCEVCEMDNCVTCSSLSSCLQCNLTNLYFVNNYSQCEYCNISEGLIINQTNQQCELCQIEGCKKCLSFNICDTCEDKFVLNNSICAKDISNASVNITQRHNISNDQENVNYSLFQLKGGIESIKCNRFRIYFYVPQAIQQIKKAKLENIYFEDMLTDVQINEIYVRDDNFILESTYSKDLTVKFLRLVFIQPKTIITIPNNPIFPLLFYSQEECSNFQNIHTLLITVQILSYICLFIGIISFKIVGLQLFGVLQLSYISLASYDFINIYMQPLTKFKTFNGLNIKLVQEAYQLLPSLKQMKIFGNFLNNCNIMIFCMFLELAVSVVIIFIGKRLDSQKCKSWGLRFLKQGFLTLILFNIFNISFASGIHLSYTESVDNQSNYKIYGTILMVISWVAVMASVIFFFCSSEKGYGQFKAKFKDNCVCRNYIFISLMYRIALGLYISMNLTRPFSTLIIISASLFYLMYNIANLPFKSTLQNYRCNLCHITQAAILISANFYRQMKLFTPMSIKGKIYQPAILVIILIILTIVFSFIVLAREIYVDIKQWRNNRVFRPHLGERQETQQIFDFHH